MKRLIALSLLAWSGADAVRGGPREDAIVAMMRLSDQPSYSWVTTVQDDARTYDIEGKTSREGFTRVKMPIINTVRRRLGRSVTDTQVEVIFHGNVRCVLETDAGWMKPDELPPPEQREDFSHMNSPPGALGIPGSRSVSGGGIMKGVVIRRRTPQADDGHERRYSNLQLAISHPHEDLGVIVGSHHDLVIDGDTVTGTLTDLGAQLLLVRDGQEAIQPLRAAGTFKLWLRDGMVSRYQVKLVGVLTVDVPDGGRKEIEVHQTSETVVKDVGRTIVAVPQQARQKLSK